MFEISIEKEFDAAHFLRGYQGKCEALHGHRYKVVVTVKSTVLNDIGLAYDFTVLKQHLGDILSEFDHTCLNDVPPFDSINLSAENIAVTIYNRLSPKLEDSTASLHYVRVWESPQSWVTYQPD